MDKEYYYNKFIPAKMDELAEGFANLTIDEVDDLIDKLETLQIESTTKSENIDIVCGKLRDLKIENPKQKKVIMSLAQRNELIIQLIQDTKQFVTRIRIVWHTAQIHRLESPVINFLPVWTSSY